MLHEPSVPDRVKVQSTEVNALDFASSVLLHYLSVPIRRPHMQ